MSFRENLDNELKAGIEILKTSDFYKMIIAGKDVEKIYKTYLQYAYHYVVNTSSFTPMAARRMDSKHLKVRRWLLDHSGEEMGHELMALKDLERLGVDRDAVLNSVIPTGVYAWMSFFYYKVVEDNPFTAFGVLYFLEGMAQELAPAILKDIMAALDGDKKKAITFFREHGELDADHLKEQQDLIFSIKLTAEEEKSIIETVKQAASIKKFMLDEITNNL